MSYQTRKHFLFEHWKRHHNSLTQNLRDKLKEKAKIFCIPLVNHWCSIGVHWCSIGVPLVFHWCSLVFIGVPLVFIGVPLVFIGVHWCSLVFHWCSLVFIGVPLVWCFRLDPSLFIGLMLQALANWQ